MKKILLGIIFLSATAQAQSTYPSGVTGCIARYTFSGQSGTGIPDSSGNNNPITYTQNLTPATGFRSRSAAMHFNGTSSVARANPSTQFNLSQVSIVALVKFSGFYAGNCQGNAIVNRGNTYTTPGVWGMEINDNGYDNSCSSYSPGFDQVGFIGPMPGGNPPAGNYIDSNKWYLLVTSYDGNTGKSYQILMDSTSRLTSMAAMSSFVFGGPLGSNTDSLRIGQVANSQYPYWLNGDVDELAIFNKALTPADIKSIYDYLFGPTLVVGENKLLDGITAAIIDNKLQVNNPLQGVLHTTVYDMTGKQIVVSKIHGANAAIDMGSFASGLYVARFEYNGIVVMKKVVKP